MNHIGYPSYKESGTPWLGGIPYHWDIKPLWSMFKRNKRTGHPHERLLSVYREYGVIPKDSRDDNANKASEDLSSYQLVKPGDLAINKMKAWQGSVAISNIQGIVSPAYFVFTPTHKALPKYLHYLFRCTRYIAGYLAISKGVRVGQWDMDPEDHARMPVLIPPKEEQEYIANFLDRETIRIDTLIEKKTRFIELLKEKRQAVITNAVTKGLDPSAPTQKSGVEWIGRIPANWSVKPLFAAAKEVYRSNKGMVESNLLSLSYGKVVRRDINAGEGLLPDSFETYQIIEDGEIVMRLTDLQNDQKSLRTALATERGIVTSAYIVIRPSDSLNSEYLAHLMRAYDIQKVFYSMGGGMRQSMKFSDLRRLPLLIPSLQEQKAICSSLHPKLARIDQLVTKTERSIELLREHRSALITAVVTGKIDVRMSK
jgi:type I restriction enzyme, S subunit